MVIYQGKEYERLPDEARKSMAERLSSVVSLYFANHPEEYEAFLEWKNNKNRKEGTN